ncbi:MAG: glycosyltransferase family 2 protein [bacterium]|nr:glycosyltransferase family 2 protein [bacterium]
MVFLTLSGFAIAALAYHFIGYPALLFILEKVFGRERENPSADTSPNVSVIVPCYNEAAVIAEKIDALRESDYSGEMEIIVSSDGSDDGTERIAGEAGATVLHNPERRGKVTALNDAVAAARHDILVFTDANAIPREGAITALVAPFADGRIGGVVGEQVISSDGSDETTGGGESAYWKYEAAIKKWEAALGGALCADGSLYSIRKELYQPPPTGVMLMDDLYISLKMIGQGYRLAYVPEAVVYEGASAGGGAEFRRKARILAGSLTSFFLVGPKVWVRTPFKLFSHKALRWLSPWLMLGAFGFALAGGLVGNPPCMALAAAQAVFYLLGLAGFLLRNVRAPFLFKAPYYFCLTNLAQLWGYWVFIRDFRKPAWEKLR